MISHNWSPMKRLIWLRGSGITGGATYATISGNPVSFTALSAPLRKLSIAFSPVQDLHGYDSPWPAGGGKNKLPNPAAGTVTQNELTCVVSADGQYAFSGATSGGSFLNDFNVAPYTIQSGDYLHCGNSAWSSAAVVGLRFTDNTSTEATISANYRIVSLENHVGKTIKSVILYVANNTTFNVNVAPMIVASSASTPFAPYSNECPISGWSSLGVEMRGVNMWDEEWEVGAYNASGTPSAVTDRIRCKNYISVKGGATYRYVSSHGTYWFVDFFDADKNPLQTTVAMNPVNTNITAPANAAFMLFYTDAGYGTTYLNNISINYPATDTSYVPYNPSSRSISISLGSTVYSGWVDAVTGHGEVTHKRVLLGDSNWQKMSDGVYRVVSSLTDMKTWGTYYHTLSWWCNIFKVGTTNANPQSDCEITTTINSGFVRVKYEAIQDDAAAFKTFLQENNAELVYELATPIPIQLTPQEINSLAGENAMFTPCDSLTVEYRSN